MKVDNLIENVDGQIIRIRTKSIDVSFNELYDMYKNNELQIAPDYQRLFRWDEEKQSRFIESLILEMPIPPVFVIEIEDGVYELIDGLQRISSYLHFRGEKLGETDEEHLVLNGCDIVPQLNELTFQAMPKALQIKIKRSFVRMEIIRKESEPSLKYHMFKRLNTGGELLSDQEIRNCTIRLLNSKAIGFIEKCSENEDFKAVINRIGRDKFNKKYDQELILRFFAMKNNIEEYRYPFTEYLTSYMEEISRENTTFNYEYEQEIFNKTFYLVNQILGEEAFSSKTKNGNIKNDFVLYYYDGIVIALSKLFTNIKEEHWRVIKDCIETIKYGEEIKGFTTGGKSSVINRVTLFENGVSEIID